MSINLNLLVGYTQSNVLSDIFKLFSIRIYTLYLRQQVSYQEFAATRIVLTCSNQYRYDFFLFHIGNHHSAISSFKFNKQGFSRILFQCVGI